MLMVAPVFASRAVPMRIRTALLVVLVAAAAPALVGAGPAPAVTAAALLGELLVGIALGLGAAVVVGAAEVAGDLISTQTGLAGAASLDPLTQIQSTSLSHFLSLTVVALLLSMNGHIVMLEVLHGSTALAPLGDGLAGMAGVSGVVSLTGWLFALGIQFAAPAIAALFVANVAVGVLARAAPQLQVFMLAYPLHILIGVLVLALTLPMIAGTLASWPGQYRAGGVEILRQLTGR
jgi:flagellar biosynthetic protein FliR